jgi:hypothetical protein
MVGRTSDGKEIYDFKFNASGRGRTSRSVDLKQAGEKVANSAKLASKIDGKIARILLRAISLDDREKQFEKFYHAIERQVQISFTRIQKTDLENGITKIPTRLAKTAVKHVADSKLESTFPFHRFLWCCFKLWESITDDDVKIFSDMKKLRNDLAHGENIPEQLIPLEAAEALTLKIMACETI